MFMDECEQSETNLLDDNSADENDVDDETMSGKIFEVVYNIVSHKI